MSAVLITGCSGAGKSTIAAVLARRGLAAIDADDDPLLARSVDPAGNVVEEEPEEPDFAWLSRHSWAWDPARLDELIRAAAPATLYLCGGADNQLELADRFTQVFLLEIDEPTMLARLDARRNYHDWGRIGDSREYLRRKLPELQDRLRASGQSPSTPGSPSTTWWTPLPHALARPLRLAGPAASQTSTPGLSPAVPLGPRKPYDPTVLRSRVPHPGRTHRSHDGPGRPASPLA